MARRRCGFPGLGAPCGGPGCEVPAPPPAVEASGDVKHTWFTYAEAEHIQEGAYARGLADAKAQASRDMIKLVEWAQESYQRGLADAAEAIAAWLDGFAASALASGFVRGGAWRKYLKKGT